MRHLNTVIPDQGVARWRWLRHVGVLVGRHRGQRRPLGGYLGVDVLHLVGAGVLTGVGTGVGTGVCDIDSVRRCE